MKKYNKVLAAIDLSPESEQVLATATEMAGGSPTTVVHVSQLLAQRYGGEIGANLSNVEAELHERAREVLAERVSAFDVPSENQHIAVGSPASEIRKYAEEVSADLIVIGTHSRHGLGILLGSTANGVLHGTSCDVMVVRINSD